MDTSGKKETRTSTSGPGPVFFVVATIIGLLSLLIGGLVVGYFAFLLFGSLYLVFFTGKKDPLSPILFLFLAVGLLAGGLTYSMLNSMETAAQISNWPLIRPLLESPATKTGLAVMIGLVSGVLAIGIALKVVTAIRPSLIRAVQAIDQALRFDSLIIIVDEGKIKKTDSGDLPARVVGPATVVVRPYNAVVLMQGSQVSRIVGTGEVKLEKEEEIKAVVDLRPQSGGYKARVRTKDNFPLLVSGGVSFRIESKAETDKLGAAADAATSRFGDVIGGDDYAVYQHTIYRAIFAVGAGTSWIDATSGAPGGKVRSIVRDYNLEDIFPLDGASRTESFLNELAEQVTEAMQKGARAWGVTVYGVGVNEIEMPEQVKQHWETIWQNRIKIIEAESDKEMEVIRAHGTHEATKMFAEAEGQAIRSLEGVKVKVLEEFINQILKAMDEDLIKDPRVAIRLIEAVEQLTRNMVADERAAVRLTKLLERLPPLQLPISSGHGYLQGEKRPRID